MLFSRTRKFQLLIPLTAYFKWAVTAWLAQFARLKICLHQRRSKLVLLKTFSAFSVSDATIASERSLSSSF